METTELLAIFREEVADTLAPYLWSDSLVYAYMDDAQKQFCRDAFGVEDARSFTIVLAPDVEWYPVDRQITKIQGVYDNLGKPIPVMTRAEVNARRIRFDGTRGEPQALIKDMQKGFFRAYPIPSSAQTLTLETLRLTETIGAGDEFEIDEQHILNLLLWVKYRAYNNQDTEARDLVKADEYRAKFKAYCDDARIEHGRLTRNVAVVKYRDA